MLGSQRELLCDHSTWSTPKTSSSPAWITERALGASGLPQRAPNPPSSSGDQTAPPRLHGEGRAVDDPRCGDRGDQRGVVEVAGRRPLRRRARGRLARSGDAACGKQVELLLAHPRPGLPGVLPRRDGGNQHADWSAPPQAREQRILRCSAFGIQQRCQRPHRRASSERFGRRAIANPYSCSSAARSSLTASAKRPLSACAGTSFSKRAA